MNRKWRQAALGAVLAAVTAGVSFLPLGVLGGFGSWLRELSLSGERGNAAAWAIVLVLTALPALGLLWRGRDRWDILLLAAAGEIFGGLYFLVNPTLLQPMLPGEAVADLWGLAVIGSVGATALAWAALRGLGRLERAEHLGRTLQKLLNWSAVLLGWLAAWSQCADLLAKIRAVTEGNTAPGLDLGPAKAVLCILAAADLTPALLSCAVLLWGGRLVLALEADPFGEETMALAERVSRQCSGVAAASALICAGGNLLQMVLFPALYATHFTVSFPAGTLLLAAALGLLCQYFRRAKAVSDDNASII